MKNLIAIGCAALLLAGARGAEQKADLKDLSISGGIENGKARLTIEGILAALTGEQKPAFATAIQESIGLGANKVTYRILVSAEVVAGSPNELPLAITGDGEIRQVSGELLQDWSIRQETNGTRTLVLRTRKMDKPPTQFALFRSRVTMSCSYRPSEKRTAGNGM